MTPNRPEHNIGLIRHICLRFRWACRNGLEFDDLVQTALLKCVAQNHRYDSAKGTYARFLFVITCREVSEYINKCTGIVRKPLPRGTVSEKTQRVRDTMFKTRVTKSDRFEADDEPLDMIGGHLQPSVDYEMSESWQPEMIDEKHALVWLRKSLRRLPAAHREAVLLTDTYERGGGLKEMAKRQGVTFQAIQNRRNKGLAELRKKATRQGKMSRWATNSD